MIGNRSLLSTIINLVLRLDEDSAIKNSIDRALAENPWFSKEEIIRALEAIRECMLAPEKFEKWLAAYPALVVPHEPKKIGIVMAGNIPLVGFFDLMCVIASGNRAYIKPSSKDRALMELIKWAFAICGEEEQVRYLTDHTPIDAIIATGGESAKLYFESKYAGIPHIVRGSRHSVAVLAGDETEAELAGLADDIFLYSGLGCRSVSLVFVPRGYLISLPARKMCKGYCNNYRQTRALLTMEGVKFEDNGTALFVRSDKAEFPKRLSQINVVEYDDIEDVRSWLMGNDSRLQCIASHIDGLHKRTIPLGRTQYPGLTDYADDIDVMEFLQSVVGVERICETADEQSNARLSLSLHIHNTLKQNIS